MIAAAVVVPVLVWGEYEHWRASRRGINPAAADRPGSEAVVVLGYRNAGDRANRVNRWRARAGLRSQQPELGPTRLVLCGGAPHGTVTEAELLAGYVTERCGYSGDLKLETESRTTRENIVNAVPLIEDADRIKIVSHPMHAEKARFYLARLRPDLAGKLVPGREYRPGEWILLKPMLALIGRRKLRRIAAHLAAD